MLLPQFSKSYGKELVRELRSKRQVAESKTFFGKVLFALSKRFLLAVAVAFVFLGGWCTADNIILNLAHAQTVGFESNLYYGLTDNQDVQALQEFLTVQGDYTGPITGNFFSLTLRGVENFQTANNLPITGYFGVLSRGVANTALASAIGTPPQSEVGSTTDATTTPTVLSSPVQASSTQTLCPVFTTPSGAIVDCNGNVLFTPQQTQTNQATIEAQQTAPAGQAPSSSGVSITATVPPSCTISGTADGSGNTVLSWVANETPFEITNTTNPYAILAGAQIDNQVGSISVKMTATTTYTLYIGPFGITPSIPNSNASCSATVQ